MRPTATHRVDRIVPAVLVMLAAILCGPLGCDTTRSDRLVVATSGSLADRRRLESEFAAWVAASSHPAVPGAVRLDWLILAPGDDPARVAQRRHPPDVLLGGSASSYERLDRMGRLAALPLDGSPTWLSRRHVPFEGTAGSPARVWLNDPRNDPFWLARAKSWLGGGHFRDGYSRLVREAAHPRRISRLAGPTSPPGVEGVAILQGCRHPELARRFLKFLAATERLGPVPARAADSPEADSLLADLLGATLVDAQDELWTAWSALERGDHPEPARRWMTEPPPWPPASVARILSRQGERAMSLVETLAGELSAQPTVRAWLIRSWLSPPRLVDEVLLHELATAAAGRLCREPNVRDWLRAEWTAWARQRYRRVARRASVQFSVFSVQ